jgi:multiple antibiotic resistance protein
MTNHLLYSSAALIALMVPLLELPIFIAITRGFSAEQSRRAAAKVAIGAAMVLLVAAVAGTRILGVFGVSLAAFRAAGGLVLILVGLQMLQGKISPVLADHGSPQPDPEDQLWVPLVMPLIAGPAAITTVITLSIREEAVAGIPVGTLIAVGVATLVVYLMLLFAVPLSAVIRPRIARVFERFFGLVLVAIGFQMGLAGVREFFLTGP